MTILTEPIQVWHERPSLESHAQHFKKWNTKDAPGRYSASNLEYQSYRYDIKRLGEWTVAHRLNLPTVPIDNYDVAVCPEHEYYRETALRNAVVRFFLTRPWGGADESEKSYYRRREATVMMMYFFDGFSHGEIGDMLGLTRERVRQIKEKCVRRLRHHLRREDWL